MFASVSPDGVFNGPLIGNASSDMHLVFAVGLFVHDQGRRGSVKVPFYPDPASPAPTRGSI